MIGILGGGLAGLSLGYFLKKLNIDFIILEKEAKVGGLCRSLNVDGYTFDYGGSHIIFSKNKEILAFMVNLLRDNLVRNRRNTKILYKNRFIKYPFENGLADIPKEDIFECLFHFIDIYIKKEKGLIKKPKNFLEWCYYTFGKGIAEKYLIPYNRKIWKYPLDQISLEWVSRLPNPTIDEIIKSALGIPTEGYVHQLYFYYPKTGGIESLVNRLKMHFEKQILTSIRIRKILRKRKNEWLIVSDSGEKFEFESLISTIPIFELVRLYEAIPSNVISAINNLKYKSLITVMLGLDINSINNFSWLYIPQSNILTHRVSFPSNYSKYMAPKGKSSIMAEITTNVGSDVWSMSSDELTKKVVDDLVKLKLINKDDVELSIVKKLKYAYVINDINYNTNVNIFRQYFRMQGIGLVGRFSEFKYLNMDETIRSAYTFVVENLQSYDKLFII